MPLVLFILLFVFGSVVARADDPYQGIQKTTLANGMTVVLVSVPSARQIEIELKVGSGWRDEASHHRGVAHLLEHAIQRDRRLGSAQTYANLFREEVAGTPVGVTSWKSTSFSVIVPSLKGVWALNEFHRMMFSREFNPEDTDRARQEVWREIGEPRDPIITFVESLYPPKWILPDFFATEFAVESTPGVMEDVRRNIRRITVADLNSFYTEHYVPNNMTLFYSGPIKVRETMGFVRDTFEKEPAGDEPSHEAMEPTPRQQPYVRSAVAAQSPWISVGTKFWDIEPQDEMALQLLYESLYDTFQREIASHTSAIANVEKKIWVDEDRYGYAVLNFELAPSNYAVQSERVQELLRRKGYYGEFSESEFLGAQRKVRKRIEDWESNSEAQLKIAKDLFNFQQRYETADTPLEVMDKLSASEVKERLAKLFQPDRAYLVKHEPPVGFRGEELAFWAIVAFLSLFGFRYAFARNFPYTRVRYVRKVRYQPWFLLAAGFVYLNILWVACQIFQGLEARLLSVNFIQNTFLLSHYALTAVFAFVVTTITLFFLGSLPRKILVVNNQLWIKSVSFRSRRFPKGMIQTIFCCRPHQLLTMGFFREWRRLFHWAFWKKGLFIELKDGTAYFLGFSNPDQVLKDLNEIFRQPFKEEDLITDLPPPKKPATAGLKVLLPFLLLVPLYGSAEAPTANSPPAVNESVTVFVRKRPFQITGQLSPFRFLVDNRLLFERPRSYVKFKLNGIDVKSRDDGMRLFQFETDSDKLTLQLGAWNGVGERMKVEPGHLKKAGFQGDQFVFSFEGRVQQAQIDGQVVTISNEQIEWHPGRRKNGPHKLTLIGEGAIPSVTYDFELVTRAEYTKRLALKQREDRGNKNRLIASAPTGSKWNLAEIDLGMQFGGASAPGLGISLAPKLSNGTFSWKGLLGVTLFATKPDMQVGPRLGLHLVYANPSLPIAVEGGPSVYLLSGGAGGTITFDLGAGFELPQPLGPLHTIGLGYSFWITPGAHQLRLIFGLKF